MVYTVSYFTLNTPNFLFLPENLTIKNEPLTVESMLYLRSNRLIVNLSITQFLELHSTVGFDIFAIVYSY